MVELQKLCDKVPSYPSEIAFKTIKDELGKSPDELFSEITPEPVAAASLGQVYKARLRETGELVAVKVSAFLYKKYNVKAALTINIELDPETKSSRDCVFRSIFST
jgi:predicted unusual protein kinase regulating ubiquinone biosynthesis (AarF/ABC1/UbiB family)